MKIGIRMSIDVTKMDKKAFYKGKKGTYANLTTFIDLDNVDQYGNNGMITQDLGKDRKDEKGPILGNNKIFWTDGESVTSKDDFVQDDADVDVPF